MAMFKVGQRVRIVDGNHHTTRLRAIAREATIVEIKRHRLPGDENTYDCAILIDGMGEFWACFWQLAPLTDPQADAFLESIRKLKPLHEEPKVERTKIKSLF